MIALALAQRPGRVGDTKDVAQEGGGAAAAGVCVYFGAGAAAPLCHQGGKWIVGKVYDYGGKVIEAVKCTFSYCGEFAGSSRDESFEATRKDRYYKLWNAIAPLCKRQDCGAKLDALVNWYVDGWQHINIDDPRYQESTAEKVNVFKDHGWQRYLDDVSDYYRDTLTPQLQIALQELLNEQEPGYVPPSEAGAPGAPGAPKPGLSTGTKVAAVALGAGVLFAGYRYWKKGKIL